ncbi:Phospholipase D delta [Sesbania bispinosa]|nr:Phospholipase D delta [Sesbania bispinosa]
MRDVFGTMTSLHPMPKSDTVLCIEMKFMLVEESLLYQWGFTADREHIGREEREVDLP